MRSFSKTRRLGAWVAVASALCAPAMAAPPGLGTGDTSTTPALAQPRPGHAPGVHGAMGTGAGVGERENPTLHGSEAICTWQSCAPRPGDSPWTLAGFGLATGAAVWLGRKPRS